MILVDANVFMYAAGAESPQRAACQALVRSLGAGRGPRVCTNAEVLQEVLHRYRSIGRADVGFGVFDGILDLAIPILAVTEEDLAHTRGFLEEHSELSTRDAVHLGVMRTHGISEIYSYDRGFDRVSWLRRLEP
jgi:uncharacterized protein